MDLVDEQQAGAAYVPACQSWYARFVGLRCDDPLRVPGYVRRDLDFLDAGTRLYGLHKVLVSAHDFMKGARPCMVEGRDRSLGRVVIMDSGGKSIITGQMKVTPATPFEVLRYTCEHGDVGVILDVPTQCVAERHPVFNTFDKCLDQTEQHARVYADYRHRYQRGRPLILLNVFQGTTPEECDRWYERMKHFEFEGFAMAGAQRLAFGSVVLPRLLRMRDEKRLEKCRWIHFLGTSSLKAAVVIDAIQEGLSMTTNPGTTVTFDDATPFTNIARNKKARLGWHLNTAVAGWEIARVPNHADYARREDLRFPSVASPLGWRLRMAHLCAQRDWPTFDDESRCLVANHDAYVAVAGVAEAIRRARLYRPDAEAMLPTMLLAARNAVIDILTSDSPGRLLERWGPTLDRVAALDGTQES